MASKRRRGEEDAEVESVEQRLVNLIVRLGDRSVEDLTHNLEALASTLAAELSDNRLLIIDTLFDTARALQPKSGVYGALSGLLNAQSARFGEDLVAKLRRELQTALEDHAPLSIRGLCRFACELMNARVLSEVSVCEVLQALLGVCDEPQLLPARAEWFVTLVLDALILAGSELSRRVPERLEPLLARVASFAAARAERTLPWALQPYGADTRPGEVLEHFEALWQLVSGCVSDGAWSFPCLLTPWRAFADTLGKAQTHAFDPITVPLHTTGCTYPSLRRIRLFDEPTPTGGGAADAAMPEASDLGSPLAFTDRVLIEEYTWMLVNAFADSHKDGAKALGWQQEAFGLDSTHTYVEVVFSMMLLLPTPRNKLIYYGCLLLDFSKLFTSVPHLLARAVNKMFANASRLDPELLGRLVDWLSLHVSHFGFNLTPFGPAWAPLLPLTADAAAADASAHAAFVEALLQQCVALSYHDRVQRELPSELAPLMPPKPEGVTAWANSSDPDAGVLATKSEALLGRLRAKAEPADVLRWLDTVIDPALVPELVVHSLLDAGSKSVSHLDKLLTKFSFLLEHVGRTPLQRVRLTAAVGSFYKRNPTMIWSAVQKLLQHRLIDGIAIVGWLSSNAGRPWLRTAGAWKVLSRLVEHAIADQRAATKALAIEEERQDQTHLRDADADADLDVDVDLDADADADGGRRGVAGARLAAKQSALERCRREKKTLLANIFVGVCVGVSEHAKNAQATGPDWHARSPAPGSEWTRAALGHALALGRRFVADLSIDALQMAVDGAEGDSEAQAVLFAELRNLHAWLA